MTALLSRQHDVISRRQALELGLSRAALKYRSSKGRSWSELLPGIYLTATTIPTMDQVDMAALLYAGTGSVITGRAALSRYHVVKRFTPEVDVLVPDGCGRASSRYVRLHRTTRMPAVLASQGQIVTTRIPRAVTDAALTGCSLREMRAIVTAGIERGRCTPDEIAAELGESRLGNCRMLRAVLAEVAAGMRSSPEGDLMDLVKRAGLPVPLYNASLYLAGKLLAIPDAWWEAVGVAVEVDSREHHFAEDDWERTMQRHARMTAVGIRVLHFSPRQIRNEPAAVISLISAALRSGSPIPGLRTVPAACGAAS